MTEPPHLTDPIIDPRAFWHAIGNRVAPQHGGDGALG